MWISGCLHNLNFAIIKYQQQLANNIWKLNLYKKLSSENDQLAQGLVILGKLRIILRAVNFSSFLPTEQSSVGSLEEKELGFLQPEMENGTVLF